MRNPKGPEYLARWQAENPELALKARSDAGKKSGEVKREKKLLRDYLSALLDVMKEDGLNYADVITAALVNKAASGDVHAYETIRDTLGQKAPEQVEMTGNSIQINITDDKECK